VNDRTVLIGWLVGLWLIVVAWRLFYYLVDVMLPGGGG
jgi:hypothetical protein